MEKRSCAIALAQAQLVRAQKVQIAKRTLLLEHGVCLDNQLTRLAPRDDHIAPAQLLLSDSAPLLEELDALRRVAGRLVRLN